MTVTLEMVFERNHSVSELIEMARGDRRIAEFLLERISVQIRLDCTESAKRWCSLGQLAELLQMERESSAPAGLGGEGVGRTQG